MWPMLEVAIEPRTPDDAAKLAVALRALAALDPRLHVSTDRESGHAILAGASEDHLDQAIRALQETHGVTANIGAPQVAYREAIGRGAQITFTHKSQAEGAAAFAGVTIRFEPGETNSGYRFSNRIGETILPASLVAGVEAGLLWAKERGLVAGFPVIDFEAVLVDATYHDVDSTPLAFDIAAQGAFRQLREAACPLLLEPIMYVEVATPEDYVGDVIGDLNNRRGMIQGTDQRGDVQMLIAMAPLSNMFGYGNVLRSMTEGRADFTMRFDHYERIPQACPPDPDLSPPAAAMRA
jgi:elongation factor G